MSCLQTDDNLITLLKYERVQDDDDDENDDPSR